MLRILVLDDEPLIAMMVQEWLMDMGCETVGPANSVTSAVRLIESDTIHAAILDISLGSEESYPVADLLRTRQIPFVLVTGHSASSITARFSDVPVLTKPFEFKTVKGVLARLLANSPDAGIAERSAALQQ